MTWKKKRFDSSLAHQTLKEISEIYDDELDTIPMDGGCKIILDVSELSFASTHFLHKLIDVKENVVLANLHGQPRQAFLICGLDGIIKTFNTIKEAEIFLKN